MTVLATILVTISLSLTALGDEQCDPTFPDGTPCGEKDQTLYLAGSIMSVILAVFNTRHVKMTGDMIQY